MKLILIRHGQTIANQRAQYQGHLDHPLNNEGLKQAETLANELRKHYQIEAIYSSSLKRALQTAKIIAVPFNLAPIVFEDLIEVDFGKWDGLTYDEIAKNYPISKWIEDPASVDIDEGEKWADFSFRVQRAFADLTQMQYETMAIVSHAGVIRNFLAGILGLKGLDVFKFELSNGAFSEVLAQGGDYRINFIDKFGGNPFGDGSHGSIDKENRPRLIKKAIDRRV